MYFIYSNSDKECWQELVADDKCGKHGYNQYAKYTLYRLSRANILLRIEPEVSSTYGTAWSGRFGKQHLTDGKKQHTSASAFYRSNEGGNEWAKITFRERSTIASVNVTNRCDSNGDRLTGAKVFIGQENADAEKQCGGNISVTSECTDAVVVCGGMTGDYVIVRHTELNIVEIEAYTGKLNCTPALLLTIHRFSLLETLQ